MRHHVAAAAGLALASVAIAQPANIGETPAVQVHLDQRLIELGLVPLRTLFDHGELVFDARFNILDGQGRPATTGGGAPRVPDQPHMIRTSGPDATSCQGCHNQPFSGGAGDFVANVFVLAQTLDPVTFSVDPMFSNERNTLGMNGSGPIEMLAREMTAELQSLRDAAKASAAQTGQPQRTALVAKGVDFGHLTALPNGKIDPTEIDGVDWDLIVKPFHQKGAVVSLREFTNNAMNHHHGIQTTERFGLGTDPDQDGMTNELTTGDVTAATLWQAQIGAPTQVMPKTNAARRAVEHGERVFREVGCVRCHIPEMTLDTQWFVEPNPYNPAGNLRPQDVMRPIRYNMTRDGDGPHIQALHGGRALVRAFTDLKRHNLNDAEYNHFANEQVTQGRLNGFAPDSDFTMVAPPRPTEVFLTRKLWDAGSTAPYGHRGDLSTLTEAIHFHGGDARAERDAFFARPQNDRASVIEFLKSLQVVDERR
ncbi:MAG: di-heme oxidoredictase family protein [Phycisphaerales bacterium]|jgi:hypothetical protein|nr:di-heme oxidoredictase family protein [Phycisphaerales bacterium]